MINVPKIRFARPLVATIRRVSAPPTPEHQRWRHSEWETKRNGSSFELALPAEGFEPTHSCEYWILSPARLPVPPRRLAKAYRFAFEAGRASEIACVVGR